MNSQLPPIFTERLQNIIPANDYDSAIKSFACPKPLQCRVNMLKTTRQEAEVYLQEKNVTFKPVEWSEDALDIFDVGSKTFGELEFVQQGKLYAQAFASMLPVLILNPQPDDCVLDMCAAPGSKTSQMAAAMNNQGSITAIEVVKNRYYRLKSVCDLLGVSNVEFKLTDARRFRANEQLFDKILVDAPCSSEGRFREQEPKSFAYWSLRKIK